MDEINNIILTSLNSVISKEEGLSLLLRNSDLFSDELADVLKSRSKELHASDDIYGAQEFEGWANEVRNLITRNIIFSESPVDDNDAARILETNKGRFDDAFIDFCVGLATIRLNALAEELLKLSKNDADSVKAAIKEAESASCEVGFLNMVVDVTQQPSHRAKALMVQGTFLIRRAQLEEALGNKTIAAETRKLAEGILTLCALDKNTPANMRARAEGNLAFLAGPNRLDEVEKHQSASQRLAEESGDKEVIRKTRRDRAYWARQHRDWLAGYELYKQNIDDTEQELWNLASPILAMELVAETAQDYESMVEVCLEEGKEDPSYYIKALEFAEQGKARAFLRSMANIGSVLGQVPTRLLRRQNEIISRMIQFENSSCLSSAGMDHDLTKVEGLSRALGMTENQIQRYCRVYALNFKCIPCNFDEMVKLVPPNGAIISYFCLPDRVIIFVIDEKGLCTPPEEVLLSRQDLPIASMNIELAMCTRGHKPHSSVYEFFDKEWSEHNLHYLYTNLVEKVKDKLLGRDIVYIVPHRSLSNLPFHAFLQPNGKALIHEFAIAYAPSLSVLRQCSEHRRSSYETCFSAGVSAKNEGPTSAQKEAEKVSQIFGTTSKQATKDVILNQSGNFDVIHLGCHSDFDSSITAFNGLVLEDEVLHQYEIAAMDCCSSLVTLSACETAHSDLLFEPGREMSGLIGAFIRAGCPSVMASLWPVPDRVLLPLMESFYKALKNGANKAEALRQAQIKLIREQPINHPYYWGSFCLWGNYQ